MSQKRLNLAKNELSKLSPDLIESHIKSFDNLMTEGFKEIFEEVSPVQDYTGEAWELHFEDIAFGDTSMPMTDARKLGLSYTKPLHVDAKLINKKTGEIKKQSLFVADIPVMNDRATFMVNGNERVVVMQVMRAEGLLYTSGKGSTAQRPMNIVKLMPHRGRWFDFEVNKYGVMSVKLLDKRPKVLLTSLLRALGYSSNEDIKRALGSINTISGGIDLLDATLRKDPTTNTEEALLDIYKKQRPEDSITIENATAFLDGVFFSKRRFYLGRVGRYQLNKKLGIKTKITEEDYVLKKDDIVRVVTALVKVNTGELPLDDIDSLANRRVRGVGELIGERIRVGVLRMEKNTRDRMSTYSTEDLVTPSLLVNTKPVASSINEFFGSSSVSRYMEQENILSELESKRRITAGGPRGLTKERATFSVRDVHSSHYSKLCPVTTPEGPSIGIVSHMAVYARVNDYGFLEAPYYRVLSNVKLADVEAKTLNGQVLRQDATDAAGKVVLKSGAKLTTADVEKAVKAGVKEVKVVPTVTDQVVYMDADEELNYKFASSSIEIDAKGKIITDKTFVRARGSYTRVPATEIDFIDINPGQIAGMAFSLVPFQMNDDPMRTLMASNMQRQAVPLVKPKTPTVGTGFEGIVADTSGRSVRAKEDGVVLDSNGGFITIKYNGGEKELFEIEKFVKTNQNTSFSQKPVVKVGEKFKKGDLLIDGPSMEDGELALGTSLLAAYMAFEGYNFDDGIIISERLVKEDVLTSIHIKEYTQDVRETKLGNEQITRDIPNVGEHALRNLDDEGVIRVGASVTSQDILVGIIAPKGETELTAEERLLRAIFGEYARDVRDNSLRLPHGDKGIVIGVQVLEKSKGDKLSPGVLKQVKVLVANTSKISIGDKLTGIHGDKGIIGKIMPEEDMPYLEDGTPVDIVLSPLFVKRMNLGQLRELETAAKANALGIRVEVPPFAEIDNDKLDDMLKKAGKKVEMKQTLYDGRTGKPFDRKVLVGPRYFLKLNHLSSNKIHARSTGSYTLVTQQPLGGKAQFGGQRFGEMEVWALEAHAAVHNLQELLTIKSDDVVGRAAAYKSIIQKLPIAPPNIPESFNVFKSELMALGLNMELVEADIDQVDQAEILAQEGADNIDNPEEAAEPAKAEVEVEGEGEDSISK